MKSKFWLEEPEPHDFLAAYDYLELLYPKSEVSKIVTNLKKTTTVKKKTKDILRASQLPLLPKKNIHVAENLLKIKKNKKLSPVLLVSDGKLVIADGYHRVCAIYYVSEDQEIPCRLVNKA
jgi:hypothetical protein